MAKVAVYIKDWGWIKCSGTNIDWTFDRKALKISTNAIKLQIPEEFIRIERLG